MKNKTILHNNCSWHLVDNVFIICYIASARLGHCAASVGKNTPSIDWRFGGNEHYSVC